MYKSGATPFPEVNYRDIGKRDHERMCASELPLNSALGWHKTEANCQECSSVSQTTNLRGSLFEDTAVQGNLRMWQVSLHRRMVIKRMDLKWRHGGHTALRYQSPPGLSCLGD